MSVDMQVSAPPEGRTGMGIDRAPGEVFDAFVNPATTKRFWICDSPGPLQLGSTVTWDMSADGAQATIEVRTFEPGRRLEFDWGDQHHMNTVKVTFSSWRNDGCYVEITETGFTGDADALATHAADSTSGFTMALCSLKALLEHDIELGAVSDRLP